MKKRNRIAFFNILSTLLLRGISIFTSPIFSRLLGTSGYGILQNYNVWTSITAIVGSLYTQGTIVNARVEFPESEQKQYQSSIMTLSLLLFLSLTALAVIFLGPITSLLKMTKAIVLLVLFHSFGSFAVNFLNCKFTYELKAGRNMILSVGLALSTLALSVLFILLLPNEINYMGRILGNAAVYGILGVAICAYILFQGRTFIRTDYWKFCLMLSLPLAFQAMSDLLLGHSDLVMLRQMKGDSAAGIYGLAYNFSGVLFAIFGALNNTWVPFFFEDMKNGQKDNVRTHGTYFMELFTVLSVGFVLLASEVYHVYADQNFWPGTNLIPLFAASYYLNFLCTFPVNFEYFHKKTQIVAAATVVSSVLNIGLNYVLISAMGMYGAVLATLLSHCFQFAMHFGYVRLFMRGTEYPFGIRFWGKYALGFAAAAAAMIMLPNLWYVRWGIGAAIGAWELLRIYRRKVLI